MNSQVLVKCHFHTVFDKNLIKVIQSFYRVVNCKELQPVVQMSKLSINSVEDIEWLPTCYEVEPIFNGQ